MGLYDLVSAISAGGRPQGAKQIPPAAHAHGSNSTFAPAPVPVIDARPRLRTPRTPRPQRRSRNAQGRSRAPVNVIVTPAPGPPAKRPGRLLTKIVPKRENAKPAPRIIGWLTEFVPRKSIASSRAGSLSPAQEEERLYRVFRDNEPPTAFQFTVTLTGSDGMPFATTTSVLGPVSIPDGTSK